MMIRFRHACWFVLLAACAREYSATVADLQERQATLTPTIGAETFRFETKLRLPLLVSSDWGLPESEKVDLQIDIRGATLAGQKTSLRFKPTASFVVDTSGSKGTWTTTVVDYTSSAHEVVVEAEIPFTVRPACGSHVPLVIEAHWTLVARGPSTIKSPTEGDTKTIDATAYVDCGPPVIIAVPAR